MRRILDRRTACMAAVGALSLLAHAKGLFAPPLDYHFHRQVNTVSIARTYWREALPMHRPAIDWEGPERRLAATEFPLMMWLHGRLWPVGGLAESWGRVIAAACSLITALLLFLLLERELGRESALYGACLFSLVPLEVYFGRSIQPEAPALMGYVAALYFWDLSLAPGRPWWAWSLAVLGAFLATALKLPYAHCLIPLAGLSWRRLGRGALTDGRLLLAGLMAMGGVLAWYWHVHMGVYVVPTRSGDFRSILGWSQAPYFTQFLLFSRFPELVTTYAGLVFFLVGARELVWKRRDVLWTAWLGGVFFHLLALGRYSHSHEYTALPLAPVAAGLMGEGLRRLKDAAAASRRPAWAAAGVVFLLAAMPVHAVLRIGHWYRQGAEVLAEAGQAAAAVSRPEDLFVTDSAGNSVFLYYLDRRGWSQSFTGSASDIEWLDDKVRRGARFFVCEKRAACAEPDGPMWKRLRAQGPPLWDRGGLVVFHLPAPH